MTRKTFLTFLASCAASIGGALIFRKFFQHRISGKIVGPDKMSGHSFRDKIFQTSPSNAIQSNVLILGGGISGLSAGYYLSKAGFSDYTILEMEDTIGGNSKFGENSISKYPWGSHYLPQPTSSMPFLTGFLKDAGIVIGSKPNGEPIFDEKYLCFDPDERIFIHGKWQEGLFPKLASSSEVFREKEKFEKLMNNWRKKIGRDGKKAFTIPVDFSSKDPEFLKLDQITFFEYLKIEGFQTKELLWYAEYATRDDYGSSLTNTSAWAGIHYYASRAVDPKGEELPPLTWPEGNGFLVSKLQSMTTGKIETGEVVYKVSSENSKWKVLTFNKKSNQTKLYICNSLIYSLPQFTRKYILGNNPYHNDFVYSPWMVANLTVSQVPEGRGAPTSWDNVIYNSSSLGYIVSTHQSFRFQEKKSVLTYYFPFIDDDTLATKHKLEKKNWTDWKNFILKDLKKCHRDIESYVENIDVMLHAHAMIRPTVNFIWGKSREKSMKSIGSIHFAHSDLSGISIFEEAHFRGFAAARKALHSINKS
ncbi:MAG: NAD(P)-binding protein [Leptospiraceae bacterium]|nr:NAD(P)-binding protein [Leptospiraceae bacterium]MCK6382405.1 NAD(P)-binding protein [Leptospiraceae bacterium]NUM42008.1 NAD(P)-binding protein [Leptospiraceae bacterium]